MTDHNGFFMRGVGLLGLICLVAGCRPSPGVEARKVRVTGASTVYPIVVMAGEELQRDGVLRIEAQAGGSTRGFEDTVAGRNDLGAMARELTPEEEARVRKFPIAYDGVGIVVHAANAVAGLSTADLRRIYRKETTQWRDFGGPDREIVVVNKAAGHATLETFLHHTGLEPDELRVDAVGGDNAQVIRLVANTEGAIGYVSVGEVMHSIEIDLPLRLVPLDGVEPTLAAVADKTYPMYRTLYLVSKEEPRGASRELIDYLLSDAGRRIIEKGMYVPLAR